MPTMNPQKLPRGTKSKCERRKSNEVLHKVNPTRTHSGIKLVSAASSEHFTQLVNQSVKLSAALAGSAGFLFDCAKRLQTPLAAIQRFINKTGLIVNL